MPSVSIILKMLYASRFEIILFGKIFYKPQGPKYGHLFVFFVWHGVTRLEEGNCSGVRLTILLKEGWCHLSGKLNQD